jgi:hypothetical protein
VVGSITISLSSTTVPTGGRVTVFGHLAASSGAPVAGQEVWLLDRPVGERGASQVASGTTGADGSVAMISPALSHSGRVRLVTGTKVRSSPITVVVLPAVEVAVQAAGPSYTVNVTTNGGDPGDSVVLQRRKGGAWMQVAATALDGSAGADFRVPIPSKRNGRYRVVLARTAAHGYAATRFTVSPA